MARSTPVGLLLLGGSVLLLLEVGGCMRGPARQDVTQQPASEYAELLPESHSVTTQYVPAGLRESPNSPVAYHVTPSMSYEDDTLDTNLAGSLELADYYRAVKRSGWQRWLQADGPYTVLAVPNVALDAYAMTWPGGLFAPSNQMRLAHMIGQTILVGDWRLPVLRRKARLVGGVVTTRSVSGVLVTLRPLPTGGVLVTGPAGQARLRPGDFPSSNGVFYISDTILPLAPPWGNGLSYNPASAAR